MKTETDPYLSALTNTLYTLKGEESGLIWVVYNMSRHLTQEASEKLSARREAVHQEIEAMQQRIVDRAREVDQVKGQTK